jgi:1,4-dihydroxy-2-naphthoyl-CoA hydrolase
MPFVYHRTIRFQDTDAAGVVYFANVLSICHEAYEASLAASGINLHHFFCYPKIAIPITHSSIDFFRPLFCGDRAMIRLVPRQTSTSTFEIAYEVVLEGNADDPSNLSECAAKAASHHTCIDAVARARTPLPPHVNQWLTQWGEAIEIL